jgi:hypothetical protein
MKMKLSRAAVAFVASMGLFATQAYAGPVIIDGTDANDHGTALGGVNQAGWLYMQKALENLAGAVTPTASKTVVSLGTDTGQAAIAIQSAFTLSSLPGAGWTLTHIAGAPAINTYFSTLSTANTGILYLPTAGNSGGDLDTAELAAVNANAAKINAFVAGTADPTTGGALFAMAESGTGAWGWLTGLIPGIVPVDQGSTGIGTDITLTAAGAAAFPGLTNAQLAGADPWHGNFSGNLGGLSVLGVALDDVGVQQNVIIGGGAGTVIACGLPGQPACPTQLPEPGTLALMAFGALGLARLIRRRKS